MQLQWLDINFIGLECWTAPEESLVASTGRLKTQNESKGLVKQKWKWKKLLIKENIC